MATKRHKVFNLLLILFPWLTMLFIGKRSLKRYSFAGVFIVIFEIINHLYGRRKKWWTFCDKRKSSFIRDELPFDLGPYMPMSLWILKYSYGNLKKYALINAIANGLFSFVGIPILKKVRIVELKRINYLQFFIYIHYKAYLLYGAQYLLEKIKRDNSALDNETLKGS